MLLSIIGPSATALVVTGHSPITILLTSPDAAGKNQLGCTDGGCFTACTTTSPCTTNGSPSDFKNTLALTKGECSPICIYFVDSSGDTWIGIPHPTPGTWTVQYNGNGKTGTFTITANACVDIDSDNDESFQGCQEFCSISQGGLLATRSALCDSDGELSTNTVTVTTGSVSTSSQSGSAGIFGVDTAGNPYPPPPPLSTPEFSFGFVAFVAMVFVSLLAMRRYRQPGN